MRPIPVARPGRLSCFTLAVPILLIPASAPAQTPLSELVRSFVSIDAPVIALTHATLIDGTGAPAERDQTVVLQGNRITAVGPSGSTGIPADAAVLDLTGKTVIPGFVMLHEHLFYPGGAGNYNTMGFSFPRLYLAGGVTTMRTGGSVNPYQDINIKLAVARGEALGPTIDATGPYLNGPGLPIGAMKVLRDAADARRMVNYWAEEGATSFKAYMQISRSELKAAIEEAHARNLKITGHLCSITYREAADLGIDDLEHGFLASTDFVEDKQPDRCPRGGTAALLNVAVESREFQSLVKHLVDKGVAITSTNTVFETFTPGRPPASAGALDAMASEPRDSYLRRRARIAVNADSPWKTLFEKNMSMEKAFHDAGGLLVLGTDPTGYGGVVAGYANQRAVILLVEAGFTVPEAIRVATLNGAIYLGKDQSIGSIGAGKEADLVVINGDLTKDIEYIRRMETVFKDGVGFDSRRIFESVRGTVGIR